MTVAVGPIEEQFARLQGVYAGSTSAGLPDGTTLVTVPSVMLPPGWNRAATTVSFIVPVGYPMARPDCFWAEVGLRLAGGGMPQGAGVNPVPGTGQPGLWFSWHLAVWNPVTDSLLTYVRVIQRRLAEPR
jgi:hypothetical protein